MNFVKTLTLSDRLALTLEGLCRAVAARVVGQAMATWMILLVWRRVRRIEGQVQRLLVRFREGRLRVRAAAQAGGAGGRSGGAAQALPRGFAWLLPLVPSEAACFAGQLSTLLVEPEMVALLQAAPQARRVLAPLCRMLGIEPTLLTPCGTERVVSGSDEGPGDPAVPVVKTPVVQSGGVAFCDPPPQVVAFPVSRMGRWFGQWRRWWGGAAVDRYA
jgi:hypothetical protein